MSQEVEELIKGLHAEFVPAKWSGQNTSGIRPLGPHVIILPDQVSSVTSGSIHIPEDMLEKLNMGGEQGVIVAYGESAFTMYADGRAWKPEMRPNPGDRVYFEKYAGRLCRGTDNVIYRLMDFQCIAAIYEPLLVKAQEAA